MDDGLGRRSRGFDMEGGVCCSLHFNDSRANAEGMICVRVSRGGACQKQEQQRGPVQQFHQDVAQPNLPDSFRTKAIQPIMLALAWRSRSRFPSNSPRHG
jgi:hypothetical protein